MNILALDVAVASVRAAVLDAATATALGPVASESYNLEASSPDAMQAAPAELWQAVTRAARVAVQNARVAGTAGDVAGVGLTSFSPGLVLLDQDDDPVVPICTPLDRRSRPAARHVWAAVGAEFLAVTGARPLPGSVSALDYRQMLTLDPYVAHRTRSYLHVNGWLGLRMTGERAFDSGNASATGLFATMTSRQWSPRWCEYYDVERAWLPRVIDAGETLGSLRSAAAAELGVPAGVPVKLGCPDLGSATLAAGMEPGDVLHIVGAVQTLATVVDSPQPHPRRLVRMVGAGERFLHVTYNPVGSFALAWLHQLCFREQSEQEFCEATLPAVRGRTSRVAFDPAALAGDPLEIEACRAAFRDLELASDRLDVLAALLEAMARRHNEAMLHLGKDVRGGRILLSGPGAESIRTLLPDLENANVLPLSDGPLCGIARLFSPR
jgi:sugar (pentulose or hexulose) kinase